MARQHVSTGLLLSEGKRKKVVFWEPELDAGTNLVLESRARGPGTPHRNIYSES
jgi:hypothetical protein